MNKTFFVGRNVDGARVFLHIEMDHVVRDGETIDHTPVQAMTRVSLQASIVARGGRSVIAAGQCMSDLASVTKCAPGWTKRDIQRVLDFWHRWHLNDMRAECSHMDLPTDPSWDVRRHVTCPETGYRYGAAWLYEPLTDEARNTFNAIMELPTGNVPQYV